MSDNFAAELKEIIEAEQQAKAELENALNDFRDNLYKILEAELSQLRDSGLGDSFSQVRYDTGAKGERRLVFTTNGMELMYLPLEGISYDPNAPYHPFQDAQTARLLVFPNYPNATPFYSYWINRHRNWAGYGLGWRLTGKVDSEEEIRNHVRTFLKGIFTEMKSYWFPVKDMNLSDISRGKPPIGFDVGEKEDQK